MAKVYARLCEKGEKNFFDVPENMQGKVRVIIEADGYEIEPDGTVVKKEANHETTGISG